MEISLAAVELFHRALTIQADYLGLDHCADLLINGYIGEERYRKMVAAAQDNPEARRRWMQDPEYVRIKAALGEELQLEPGELNPLDLEDDPQWEREDPRLQAWFRASQLGIRLQSAMVDWIATGRRWPIVEVDDPASGRRPWDTVD